MIIVFFVIIRIVLVVFIAGWIIFSFIVEKHDDKLSKNMWAINKIVFYLVGIYFINWLWNYSPINLDSHEILDYAKKESENIYDPLEYLWGNYGEEPYTEDDMLKAYADGVTDGIDYTIEYFEYNED